MECVCVSKCICMGVGCVREGEGEGGNRGTRGKI